MMQAHPSRIVDLHQRMLAPSANTRAVFEPLPLPEVLT